MNLRTRAALMFMVSAMPARQINVSRVVSLADKLNKLRDELAQVPNDGGNVDVRDLLTLVLTESGA